MAVIDGRFRGEGEGATIAETAYIARLLGLVEALNLDGGGSSTLWTARKGVLNHPYDNHRFDHAGERAVPNCIVVRSKNGEEDGIRPCFHAGRRTGRAGSRRVSARK